MCLLDGDVGARVEFCFLRHNMSFIIDWLDSSHLLPTPYFDQLGCWQMNARNGVQVISFRVSSIQNTHRYPRTLLNTACQTLNTADTQHPISKHSLHPVFVLLNIVPHPTRSINFQTNRFEFEVSVSPPKIPGVSIHIILRIASHCICEQFLELCLSRHDALARLAFKVRTSSILSLV